MRTNPDIEKQPVPFWELTGVGLMLESPVRAGEAFAALLLVRWAGLQDAERAAMAAFDRQDYQPLLPARLQWQQWAELDDAVASVARVRELSEWLGSTPREANRPLASYLHTAAEPIRRLLAAPADLVHDLVRWVASLPFETPAERRALLATFDQAILNPRRTDIDEHVSPANIAHLVAALANPRPGDRVYDPCFGSGRFLVAAWQRAEQDHPTTLSPLNAALDVSGVEINASVFLIGLVRMLLAGIEAPRLQLGGALEREPPNSLPLHGFDVILADPPFGAKISREHAAVQQFAFPTTDSSALFVQHALTQLKPHGRAIVVVPKSFLFGGGAVRDLRRQLIEKGQVEAVIGLPAGVFMPHTAIVSAVVVLTKQGGANRIRMADASPFFEKSHDSKAQVIRPAMADQLARMVLRAQTGDQSITQSDTPTVNAVGSGRLTGAIWDVAAEDLASLDWDLTPQRREQGGLDDLLAGIKDGLGDQVQVVPLGSIVELSSGKHVKATDLTDARPEDGAIGYIRIGNLANGKVNHLSNWLRPDAAQESQPPTLLPGDVLVSKSGTIGKAAVVRNGAVGSMASSGLYALRPDKDRLEAGFLLAYLASPACKNWLASRSRGVAIQHLNRAALETLPVLVPPMAMQVRAAEEFREQGTDALAFLSAAAGESGSSWLTGWLAELEAIVPKSVQAATGVPALSQFEPIVALARTAHDLVQQGKTSSRDASWLWLLTDALLPLGGVDKIPPGPALMSVLQEADLKLQSALTEAAGHQRTQRQARALCQRLLDWLVASTAKLLMVHQLQVPSASVDLMAGGVAEATIELKNASPLPLRNVRIWTRPDWGTTEIPYFAEQSVVPIHLHGSVPGQVDALEITVFFAAQTLRGLEIEGQVGVSIRVVESATEREAANDELSGSPYVTGSPLEPQHGDGVFFGREGVIAQISRQISTQGNVVLLEGNRRAGKTSILKHLEGAAAIPNWLCVYASLQGAEGASNAIGVPTTEVFREIARSVAKALTKLGIDTPLPDGRIIAAGSKALGVARACQDGIREGAAFVDFRDYLDHILAALEPMGLGLVLMLDEFDKLQEGIDNGVTSPQVPENIRFLIQSYPRFSAILTGSRRLKRLREEYWSALYGLGTSIQVTALDEKSAREVVTEPVRGQLTFSREAVDRAIWLTARQPYLLQCLCDRVYDFAVQTSSRSITLNAIDDAAGVLVKDNEHFSSLWDYAAVGPETGRHRRQLILSKCAQCLREATHMSFEVMKEQLAQVGVEVSDELLETDLAYLRELDLVVLRGEIGNHQYELEIPLMADWIEQRQDMAVLESRARTESEEEGA